MNDELTHVISITGLVDVANEPTGPAFEGPCPREGIGYDCVRDTSFACLCEFAESTRTEIHRNRVDEPVSLTLRISVHPTKSREDVATVMAGIQMTSLKSVIGVSNRLVEATFDLDRHENKTLKAFVAETA